MSAARRHRRPAQAPRGRAGADRSSRWPSPSARTRMVDLNVTGRLSAAVPDRGRRSASVLAALRPPRGPLAAAVRRPGAPALRGPAQRARAGDDPPDRPDQRPADRRGPAAADLDRARGGPVHPGRGAAARPPAAAAASPTPSGWPAWCCCCCRWCPGSAREKFGAQIWIQVGPYSFQPAEAAKVLLAIAFAVVPGGEAGRARAGRLPDPRASTCRGPATSARSW